MRLIFATNSNPDLVKTIAAKTGFRLGKYKISRFIDQEISLRIKESVKNKEIYILGSSFPPAENFLELVILINTLKINGAKKIWPYLLLLIFLFTKFLLCFLCFCKIKHHAIDAIPKPSGFWAIIKHMPKMCFASAALHFGSYHSMCMIGSV